MRLELRLDALQGPLCDHRTVAGGSVKALVRAAERYGAGVNDQLMVDGFCSVDP